MRVRIVTACGCWRDLQLTNDPGGEVRISIAKDQRPSILDGEPTKATVEPGFKVRRFSYAGRGRISGVQEYHEVVE